VCLRAISTAWEEATGEFARMRICVSATVNDRSNNRMPTALAYGYVR
jgi:hypothetical protein